MNREPPEPPLPPPDRNGGDETRRADVVESLTAYDEQLRLGSQRTATRIDVGAPTDDAPPTDLVDCLHLLERIWPRSGADSVPPSQPERIGRFEIEHVLGHGGFGIVYLATDPVLNRQIALKVPRLHSLADEGLRERFRREARAAATLDHPNIVPIYETGADGPVEYIATAYCAGSNLAEWLKEQSSPVPPRVAALITAQLADAAHYSHSHGVLHRDLKPGNVMLVPVSGDLSSAEDGELPFVPRLTDFGLAKLLEDESGETAASAMLGTPAYMAPEQIGGSTEPVGPHTDVYALGVLLYEVLTRCQPFQGSGVADVLDQIRRREPVAPRRLRRDIPRDLETICLKCLEKSSRQRFASAHELAEELYRYLRGQPLHTKPPGPLRVAAKWVRRRRLATALIATVALAAIGVPALLIAHNRRLSAMTEELGESLALATHWRTHADSLRATAEQAADDARQRRLDAEAARIFAETQRQTAAQMAYVSSVRLAELAWRDSDIRQCRAFLAAAAKHTDPDIPPALEWKFLDHQTRAAARELGDPSERFWCVAASPDGRTLAAGGEGGRVQIIDVDSGNAGIVLGTPHGIVRNIVYNWAGTRLATCGDDRSVTVWNPITGERLFASPPAPGQLQSIVWLLDDEWIAAAGGSGFPGVPLWKVSAENETATLETGTERVTALARSADGRRLAAGGHDGTVWIWEAATRKLVHQHQNGRKKITSLAYSYEGNHLAIGGNDQRIRLCSLNGDELREESTWLLRDDIRSLAFSPRDDRLAVLEQFGTLHQLPLPPRSDASAANAEANPATSATASQVARKSWQAHERRGSQLVFLPDGSQLATVGGGSRLRLWNIDTDRNPPMLPSPPVEKGWQFHLLFSRDSKYLITAAHGLKFWSVETLQLESRLSREPTPFQYLALSSDGTSLAAGSQTAGVVELRDVSAGAAEPVRTVRVSGVDSIAFSPLDDVWAIANWMDDSVFIFDRNGAQLRSLPARQCHEVAFSCDGQHLVVDDQDDIVVWSTASWSVAARLKGHLSTILTLAFSPDGRWLASGGRDREIRLWSTRDWRFIRGMNGHRSEVQSLMFTPDSRSLVALDGDDYIKVWHPGTGLELCNIRTPADGPASHFALSPDTRHFAIHHPDGRVELQRLWSED